MTAIVDVNSEEYNKLLEDSSTLRYLKDAIADAKGKPR